MHLAMVVDESRLATDGPAIQRTAVAMASAGARIHRVIPTFREEPPLARLLPASGFEFGSSRLFWPSRLGALSSALEEDRPDAFIAFGARAFTFSHGPSRPAAGAEGIHLRPRSGPHPTPAACRPRAAHSRSRGSGCFERCQHCACC